LRDVSLSVGQGEVVALLGLNGAGKTTTLRSILGLTRGTRRKRSATTATTSPRGPAYKIARLGVGYVPEGRRMFKDLSTLENLQLAENGRGGGLDDPARARAPAEAGRAALARKPGRLSGGEQEMLAIGRALVSNPRLLLIDEPRKVSRR